MPTKDVGGRGRDGGRWVVANGYWREKGKSGGGGGNWEGKKWGDGEGLRRQGPLISEKMRDSHAISVTARTLSRSPQVNPIFSVFFHHHSSQIIAPWVCIM